MPVLLHPRQKLSLDDTADACTEKYLFGDHRRKFNKCLSQLEQRIFPSLAHAAWLVKHIETRREEFWTDQYIEEKIQPPVFWEGTPWRWQRAGFQCHKDNFSDTLFIINAGLPILKFGPIGDKTRHQKKFHGCLKDIEVMSTNYLRKIWTGGATKEKQRRAFWANEYNIDNDLYYGFRSRKFWFAAVRREIHKFDLGKLKRAGGSFPLLRTVDEGRLEFWENEYRIDNDPHYGFRSRKFYFYAVVHALREFDRRKLKKRDDMTAWVRKWQVRNFWRETYVGEKRELQNHKNKFASALTMIVAMGIEMDEEEEREAALLLRRPYLVDIRDFDVDGKLKYTWNMADALEDERNARTVTRYLKEKKIHQRVNMQVHRHGRCMNAIDGYGAATRDGHRVLRVTDNQLQIELEAEDRLKAFKVQVIEDRLTSVKSRFSRPFEWCAIEAAKKAEGFMFAMWKTDNLEYAIRVRERWQWHCEAGTTLSEKGIKTHNAMLYLSKMDQKYGK